MNKPLLAGIALFLAAAAALSFNPPEALVKTLDATDVVAIYAKSSSRRMLGALPEKPAASPDGRTWRLRAPDGGAELSWPAGAGSGETAMRVPAAPFLAAGLDASRLPAGILRDGMLTFSLGGEDSGGAGKVSADSISPAEAFAAVLDAHRDQVAYHFQLGHFGIDLGGGNLLEWAGEPETNALDLVFVLDPAALIGAGVDPNRVEGWLSGSVIIHDSSGRKVEAPKLLKPFNLL